MSPPMTRFLLTPTSAKPASAKPFSSSMMKKRRRQRPTFTLSGASARKRRPWSSRTTLAPMTITSQTMASSTGDQNMEAIANSA